MAKFVEEPSHKHYREDNPKIKPKQSHTKIRKDEKTKKLLTDWTTD